MQVTDTFLLAGHVQTGANWAKLHDPYVKQLVTTLVRPGDVIVSNFAHSYNFDVDNKLASVWDDTDTIERYEQDIDHHLKLLIEITTRNGDMHNTKSGVHLFWREAAPQHFPTASGMWKKPGSYSPSNFSKAVNALPSEAGGCVAELGASHVAQGARLRDRIAANVTSRLHVPLLLLAEELLDAGLQHVCGHKCNEDCTHWRLEGSLVTLSLLVHQLIELVPAT